jgi:Fic family protein
MSSQIRRERNDYYTTLEHVQKGTLDVTEWQEWFLSSHLVRFSTCYHSMSSSHRLSDADRLFRSVHVYTYHAQ